ncbi:MAG: murein L,D-transpeptidase family protein [Crocinitomicaceae bacterium]
MPPGTMIRYLKFAIIALAFTSCAQTGETDSETTVVETQTEQTPLLEQVRANNYAAKNLEILIDKSDYTLQVYHKESLLITYPCVFGFDAVSDKMKEGDGATPEGEFGIRSMYPHRSWSYFIWIDYPNEESWKRFRKRKADGTIENSATIGGEVGIHGVPEGADDMIANRSNWTLGCISLTNKHITDLYKSISSETKIRIIP